MLEKSLKHHTKLQIFDRIYECFRTGDDWTETEAQQSPVPSRASTSNHSEIEKRRRDRMNELIGELSALVPAASSKKLDKLSVLRLALQHIASLTPTNDGNSEYGTNGETLPITEFITLIEKSMNGFLMVTDVETGNIVYASESSTTCLSMTPDELTSRNWFDIIHQDDVRVFRDEIMATHLDTRRLSETSCDYVNDCVSSSTNYSPQHNELDVGLKRSFLCRINVNPLRKRDEKAKYQKFKCSGVLKDGSPLTAILLVMKFEERSYANHSFQMRILPNGRIFMCDEEVCSALGYLPNQVLSNSYYDLVNEGDLIDVSHHHRQVVRTLESRQANYRLRTANDESVMCNCIWQPFRNPWTEQLQSIVLLHTTGYPRKENELTPEQSTLKQLLSNKQAPTAVLGVARFGDSVSQ